MDDSSAFDGVACTECGVAVPDSTRVTACQDCGGPLATRYDFEGAISPADLPPAIDQYRFAPFLPFDREAAVTLGEGGTPLVDCPALADDAGVGRLLVKDEGANPTGSIADRGASLAVTAVASESGAESDAGTVALPSTGHGGRSVAAYAARAGLDAKVFLPARAPFDCKAMVNVHGGEMTVVGGRFDDARAAFEDARESAWADLGPGSAVRRNGAASCYGEVLAAFDWSVPDAVVVPTGHGTVLAGLSAATERFRDAGVAAECPAIVVAQPEGCAPVVDAVDREGAVEPIADPDTIAGALEVPDPVLGDRAAAAVREAGRDAVAEANGNAVAVADGNAVAVADDDALAAAVDANATAGVEVGVAGGVGIAAAETLGSELPDDATVVVLNPTAGGTESDVLRSHLMGQGV